MASRCSCTLYTPACAVEFAIDKYLNTGATAISPDRLRRIGGKGPIKPIEWLDYWVSPTPRWAWG